MLVIAHWQRRRKHDCPLQQPQYKQCCQTIIGNDAKREIQRVAKQREDSHDYDNDVRGRVQAKRDLSISANLPFSLWREDLNLAVRERRVYYLYAKKATAPAIAASANALPVTIVFPAAPVDEEELD